MQSASAQRHARLLKGSTHPEMPQGLRKQFSALQIETSKNKIFQSTRPPVLAAAVSAWTTIRSWRINTDSLEESAFSVFFLFLMFVHTNVSMERVIC